MLLHFAVLPAALAHLAVCALVAAFSLRIKIRRKNLVSASSLPQGTRKSHPPNSDAARTPGLPRRSALFLFSLFPWLCIPNGAFPALVNSELGAPAALFCLATASLLGAPAGFFRKSAVHARFPDAASALVRRLMPVTCLGISLALLALYARQRGLPGDLLSLDSYAAMPLRELTESREKIGLLLLASACLLACLRERRDALPLPLAENTPEPADTGLPGELSRLAACAFLLCLFMPLNFLRAPGSPVAIFLLNAAFFQLRLFCLEHALCLLAEYVRPSAALPCPLLAAGALCLL